jgi:hypothetical protein
MELLGLIEYQEYTLGLYDFKLLTNNDRKLDIYVRHNTRMSIYEAKGCELNNINNKVGDIKLHTPKRLP